MRLAVERKRIMDAIRMATYNAESALARLLAPHYARADDEAALLREAFKSPADLQVIGTELHVRCRSVIPPPHPGDRGTLRELTATKTVYPGTDLTLVYSTKVQRWSPTMNALCKESWIHRRLQLTHRSIYWSRSPTKQAHVLCQQKRWVSHSSCPCPQ